MNFTNALASVAVKDIGQAEAWYAELLGRPPDTRPMPSLCEWRFPEGGWLQVYQAPERAGGTSCTLTVPNLEQVLSRLERLRPTRMDGEAAKVAMLTDPDGNSLALAQPLGPAAANAASIPGETTTHRFYVHHIERAGGQAPAFTEEQRAHEYRMLPNLLANLAHGSGVSITCHPKDADAHGALVGLTASRSAPSAAGLLDGWLADLNGRVPGLNFVAEPAP